MKCFKTLVSVTALGMLICGLLLFLTQEAQATPVLNFTPATFKQVYNSTGTKLGTRLKITNMATITDKNNHSYSWNLVRGVI